MTSMSLNQSGIYEILNTVNGKRYIGQTSNFKKRWKEHRTGMKRGDHGNRYLQRAWDKYGEEAFKFLPILTCAPSMLTFYEQQLLDKVKPEYNLAPIAGTIRGIKFSAQARKNMSEAHIGKPGRPMSDETKAILREINLGRKPLPESIEKMRRTKTGKKQSPEQIAARVIGQTGLKRSDEAKANMSKAQAGRTLSPEHCANISISQKGNKKALGHKKSEASKAAQSAKMKARIELPEHRAARNAGIQAYWVEERARRAMLKATAC